MATVLDDLLAGAINSEALAGLSWLLDKLAPYIIGPVLGKFIPDGVNDINGKPFVADSWYRGLPMDNQIDDLILPTWFTEIWIPYSAEGGELEKTIAVLKEHLRGDEGRRLVTDVPRLRTGARQRRRRRRVQHLALQQRPAAHLRAMGCLQT